jgi:REP element-mobilizing transposase RayT
VPHRSRAPLAARYPVHVTLRVRRDVKSLRRKWLHQTLWQVFLAAKERPAGRITDWSVQGNHIHLVVEAKDGAGLSRTMQGLSIRLARALNAQLARKGPVFADRFHSRILRTPREVRNAVAYVLHNAQHHGNKLIASYIDAFSSAAHFDGWAVQPSVGTIVPRGGPPPIAEPTDVAAAKGLETTWVVAGGTRLI